MEIKEFSKIMQYLVTAYNKELNNDMLAVWYDFFKKYDLETFKNGILQAINQCKYLPSIAEVKEIITSQNSPLVSLKADEEWEKVREVASSIGRYREEEALSYLNPVTRNVVRRIGYQDICNADEYTRNNLRNAFMKSFESEKEDLIRYESSIRNDTEDMIAIQERNRNVLGHAVSGLIKHVDDIIEDEEE